MRNLGSNTMTFTYIPCEHGNEPTKCKEKSCIEIQEAFKQGLHAGREGIVCSDLNCEDCGKSKEEQCSVCGYYCLGKGGIGCIDKPSLLGSIEKEECKHRPMPYHFEGEPQHNVCGKCWKKLYDTPTSTWEEKEREEFLEMFNKINSDFPRTIGIIADYWIGRMKEEREEELNERARISNSGRKLFQQGYAAALSEVEDMLRDIPRRNTENETIVEGKTRFSRSSEQYNLALDKALSLIHTLKENK